LFVDLELIFKFLLEKLPSDLAESVSSVMMPAVVSRITTVWLDSAVPSSLKMDEFKEVIQVAKEFCAALKALGLSGFGELQEWVDSAPRIWLSKCREAALDSIRSQLAGGTYI
jgi:centromere/kinetochore protein ZW10